MSEEKFSVLFFFFFLFKYIKIKICSLNFMERDFIFLIIIHNLTPDEHPTSERVTGFKYGRKILLSDLNYLLIQEQIGWMN